MKVFVSQKNIDEAQWGVAKADTVCPLALALKDMGLRAPSVGPAYAKFFEGDEPRKMRLSEEARDFVEAFDLGDPVFSCTLELLEEAS